MKKAMLDISARREANRRSRDEAEDAQSPRQFRAAVQECTFGDGAGRTPPYISVRKLATPIPLVNKEIHGISIPIGKQEFCTGELSE